MTENDAIPTSKVIHEIVTKKEVKNGEVVTVNSLGKKILDSDEKQQLEAQRNQAIIEAFEAEKQLLIQEYPQYKDILDENVTSGFDLEVWREKMAEMAEEGKISRKPKGQATLEPVRSKGTSIYEADSYQQLVDKIYSELEKELFLRDMAKPYNMAKVKKLEAMRSKLLQSVLTGEKSRGVTKNWFVWMCPTCQISVANSRTCEKCGYENRSPSSVKGRVNYV